MSDERWSQVAGYEGLYDVSDLGRVRSCGRYTPTSRGAQRWWAERMLTPSPIPGGYRTVRLYRNGVGRTRTVHRLVLEAFVGPAPEGMECCHGPGGPADNRLTNLRWDTQAANSADQFEHGTQFNAHKTQCLNKHDFTPENTYLVAAPGGRTHRRCRECARIRDRNRIRSSRKKESA